MGALLTSFLFTLGKFAIGVYLGKASVASSYGAAGWVVILLLWVYYSSLILYLGAEFTHVYSMRHGSRRGATHAPMPDRREGRSSSGSSRPVARPPNPDLPPLAA